MTPVPNSSIAAARLLAPSIKFTVLNTSIRPLAAVITLCESVCEVLLPDAVGAAAIVIIAGSAFTTPPEFPMSNVASFVETCCVRCSHETRLTPEAERLPLPEHVLDTRLRFLRYYSRLLVVADFFQSGNHIVGQLRNSEYGDFGSLLIEGKNAAKIPFRLYEPVLQHTQAPQRQQILHQIRVCCSQGLLLCSDNTLECRFRLRWSVCPSI